MTEAVIVALITGAFTIVSQLFIAKSNNEKLYAQLDKQSELADTQLNAKLEKWQAVTDTKIEELTREVRKHNSFAERLPVLEEKMEVSEHRIADLEQKNK
jgi:hypothetical protein